MDKLASLSPEAWERIAQSPASYPFAGDGRYVHECHVRAPLDEVWGFFSRPKNVRELTPPRFGMEILTGDGESEVSAGRGVTYRTRVLGVAQHWPAYFPLAWKEELRAGFIDIRVGGVFRRWCHVHRFEVLPGGGTRVLDELRWRLAPGGPVGWVGDLVVERQIRGLFRYRQERLDVLFGVLRGSV